MLYREIAPRVSPIRVTKEKRDLAGIPTTEHQKPHPSSAAKARRSQSLNALVWEIAEGVKFSEGVKLKPFQSEPVPCLFTEDSRGRTALSGNQNAHTTHVDRLRDDEELDRTNQAWGNFVKFAKMSFLSKIISGICSGRFVLVMGLAALWAAAPPAKAQITFLGAQRTVAATGLSTPNGAALDSSGNLYISDTGLNRVVKIDPTGNQTLVSTSPFTLSSPLGLAVDSVGNLYVCDEGNGRVVKVPAGGGAATVLASVLTPEGAAVDPSGNVFVTDNEDGFIEKITSGGVSSIFEIGLTNPVDVAVDAAGNVYLADSSLSSIVKFPAGGGAGSNVGSSLAGISGVAVDRSGNVYVSENAVGAVIVEISAVGVQSTLATSGLAAATHLAVDPNYDIFIPDHSSSDVIEFSTMSVPLGFANVCQDGAPGPCSQTATLQFALGGGSFVSSVQLLTAGDTGLDFSQSGVTCAGTTTPCTVQVTFQPGEPGLRSGAVALLDECEGTEFSVPVYGTGNGANAGFSPAVTSPPFGSDGFVTPVAVAVAGIGIFSSGPAFIADSGACVIWIANNGESFTVYAGNGTCGYAGDGGAATGSAEINTPGDVTVDGVSNVYIADSANHLIRRVDRNGIISTVAGNFGLGAGLSGDGGPATNAQLRFPSGVAVDLAGNLYIADTQNSRIRKVDLAGIITTVAGSDSAGYSGDGGAATSAALNQPTGVSTDSAGNLFIADTNNNVVRKVDLTGKITTVAGDFGLGAGYSGDGDPAVNAQLNAPDHVSVDAAGELFISDGGNGVIRQVSGSGTISTYPVPTDFPEDLTVDASGNFWVVDPEDGALTIIVRTMPLGLTFAPQDINTSSAAQDVSVTNIGNQSLAFSMFTLPTGFELSGPDNSCSTDSALSIGTDCILAIAFQPPTSGAYSADVVLTDDALGPAATSIQSVPVSGTGNVPLTTTVTTLTASPNPASIGQTVTLTATVTPAPTGVTLGSVEFCLGVELVGVVKPIQQVTFGPRAKWMMKAAAASETPVCAGSTLLGTVSVSVSGTATLPISSLAVGTNSIRALYEGNVTFANSISQPLAVTINALTSTATTLMVSPSPGAAGQTITLTGTVAPVPTGSPLGSIRFCDAGGGGAIIHRISRGKYAARARDGLNVRPDGGGGSPCGGDTPLGTVTVTAPGVAAFTTSSLAVGDHTVYAVYSGNTAFAGSTSDTQDETVGTAFAVTAPQTPLMVAEGGSVQLTVTVPPIGGTFAGTVALAATGLPLGATATFDPPTVTPGAAGAQTVMTIQLATAGAQQPGSTPSWPTWPILPAASIGLLALGAISRRRPLPRFAAVAVIACAICAAALVMGGCAGSTSRRNTPAGQYTVTITGTSGSLHSSTTVSVVVQ
jgi:sugar lactone lactonase YvrE